MCPRGGSGEVVTSGGELVRLLTASWSIREVSSRFYWSARPFFKLWFLPFCRRRKCGDAAWQQIIRNCFLLLLFYRSHFSFLFGIFHSFSSMTSGAFVPFCRATRRFIVQRLVTPMAKHAVSHRLASVTPESQVTQWEIQPHSGFLDICGNPQCFILFLGVFVLHCSFLRRSSGRFFSHGTLRDDKAESTLL